MLMTLTTKCGKNMGRSLSRSMELLNQEFYRNAVVGATTLDNEGNYVEIESVTFTNT